MVPAPLDCKHLLVCVVRLIVVILSIVSEHGWWIIHLPSFIVRESILVPVGLVDLQDVLLARQNAKMGPCVVQLIMYILLRARNC